MDGISVLLSQNTLLTNLSATVIVSANIAGVILIPVVIQCCPQAAAAGDNCHVTHRLLSQ